MDVEVWKEHWKNLELRSDLEGIHGRVPPNFGLIQALAIMIQTNREIINVKKLKNLVNVWNTVLYLIEDSTTGYTDD